MSDRRQQDTSIRICWTLQSLLKSLVLCIQQPTVLNSIIYKTSPVGDVSFLVEWTTISYMDCRPWLQASESPHLKSFNRIPILWRSFAEKMGPIFWSVCLNATKDNSRIPDSDLAGSSTGVGERHLTLVDWHGILCPVLFVRTPLCA